jgi:hypothetical protein
MKKKRNKKAKTMGRRKYVPGQLQVYFGAKEFGLLKKFDLICKKTGRKKATVVKNLIKGFIEKEKEKQ